MNEHWTDRAVSLLNPVDSELLTAGEPLRLGDDRSPVARRPRKWLPVLGSVVALLGGATAYAATELGGGDTHIVNLQCELPDGDFAGRVETGDPIADCRAVWRTNSSAPIPPLVAYVFNNVTYYVQPASAPAPKDPRMRLLAGSVATDPVINELKDALTDVLAGPSAACLTTEQARANIRAIATRLGVSDVPVRLLKAHGTPRTADGRNTCAVAYLDTGAKDTTIALFSLPANWSNYGSDFNAFVQRLRAAPACQDLTDAKATVTKAAQEAGISLDPELHQLTITSLADPSTTCTRIYVEPGTRVTLRGPA
jgi:hypothetical protein